ncbi:MAG: metal-sulfur cluster assembly factor [Bacteroidota bacterium]|nr:metal-sulfur cluster assembly factor [Bacteroidota bacterium]
MNEISNNEAKCRIALESLQHVIDPEIGLNVVDLGLIYQINFDEDHSKIDVVMTLTTQFCPMGESITEAVKNALEHAFEGMETHVELSFIPGWDHTLISEAGLKFLKR